MAKKRTFCGNIKPPSEPQHEPEPPSALPSQGPQSPSTEEAQSGSLDSRTELASDSALKHVSQPSASKPHPRNDSKRQKLPKLPKSRLPSLIPSLSPHTLTAPVDAIVTKRPLLHPAISTPFSSSQSPKILYITASSSYIPCVKRIRKLLSLIKQRSEQSLAAQSKQSRKQRTSNRRLAAIDIERDIVAGVAKRKQGEVAERVYLKASGRAIPRALELGVHFQMEGDCMVRVEMGNVYAVDDIELSCGEEEEDNDDDVPETRLRLLSSVTVSIAVL